MPSYIAESCLSRARRGELPSLAARTRDAAGALPEEGRRVTYLRSAFVPEDEVCPHWFIAPSPAVVIELERLPMSNSRRARTPAATTIGGTMRTQVSLIAALITLALGATASTALASASTTPSLTGEQLTGTSVQAQPHCNSDGTGYITFSASGTAAGPYDGAFTEAGVVAITEQNGLFYENFYAGFQISSTTPSASVRGIKAEVPPETFAPPPGLSCQDYAAHGYTTIGNASPNLYWATIDRDDQTYRDLGTTDVTVLWATTHRFDETFVSSNGLVLTASGDGE